jgi:hypothetical protein
MWHKWGALIGVWKHEAKTAVLARISSIKPEPCAHNETCGTPDSHWELLTMAYSRKDKGSYPYKVAVYSAEQMLQPSIPIQLDPRCCYPRQRQPITQAARRECLGQSSTSVPPLHAEISWNWPTQQRKLGLFLLSDLSKIPNWVTGKALL